MNYQKLYDSLAPVYAPAMRLLPVWLKYAQQALLWLPPAGDVLEIGPGPGVVFSQLAERYALAVGLDLSPGMLRHAQRRLRNQALPDRLVEADALHLPTRDRSFDGVVLTFVFSAIPDGSTALREIQRVLRPQGRVILIDACFPDNGNRIARGLGHLWELFGDQLRDESSLMREVGFDVIERYEFGAFNSIRLTVGRKM
jgi:demethylmenaquinone methyltransferase / 2-methoxy-6-polyprenyl-1,4-benzoquinol methylase